MLKMFKKKLRLRLKTNAKEVVSVAVETGQLPPSPAETWILEDHSYHIMGSKVSSQLFVKQSQPPVWTPHHG